MFDEILKNVLFDKKNKEIRENKDKISFTSDIPTMKDIRGKVWIFDDFGYGKGFPVSNKLISKQNKFAVIRTRVKIDAVEKHFKNNVIGNKDSGNIYINNLSANSAALGYLLKTPQDFAKKVNDSVFNFKGFLGIVVFDFPSEDVIRYVIRQNSFITLKTLKNRRKSLRNRRQRK